MENLVKRIHYEEIVTTKDIDDFVKMYSSFYSSFPTTQLSQLFHTALEYRHMNAMNSILYYQHSEPLELRVPSWLIDELMASDQGVFIMSYLAQHHARRKSWVRLEFEGRQIATLIEMQEEKPSIKGFLDTYLQCKDNKDHLFTRMDWDLNKDIGFESVDTEYMDYMSSGYRGYCYQDYPEISSVLFEYWDDLKGYIVGTPTVNHMLLSMVTMGRLDLLVDYTKGHSLNQTAMCMLLHVMLPDLLYEFDAFFSEPSEWSSEWLDSLWDKTLCIRYLYDTQLSENHGNLVLLEPFRVEVDSNIIKLHNMFGKLRSLLMFIV